MNPEGDCVDMEMCRDNAVPVLSVDSAVNAEADECEVTASRALLVESDELEANIPVAEEVLTDGNLEDPPENVTTSELNPAGDCVDMNRGMLFVTHMSRRLLVTLNVILFVMMLQDLTEC